MPAVTAYSYHLYSADMVIPAAVVKRLRTLIICAGCTSIKGYKYQRIQVSKDTSIELSP